MDRPTREQFAAVYLDQTLTITEVCRRLGISDTTCAAWVKRFGMEPRRPGRRRSQRHNPASKVALQLIVKDDEDHCDEMNDGPGPRDRTPDEIVELAAYVKARNLLAMQTHEDAFDRYGKRRPSRLTHRASSAK